MASDRDDRRAAATALASLQRLADLGPALSCPPTARCLPTPMPRCKPPSAAPNGSSTTRRRRLVRRPPRLRLRPDDLRRHPRRRPRPVPARPRLVHRRRPAAPPLPRRPASELVRSMTSSSAIVITDGKVRAAAPHIPVDQRTLNIPYPKGWT